MNLQKIVEDAMVAAAAAGAGDVVPASNSAGIGANDVLGQCDHKTDGYLGSGDAAGCFHIPGKCKVPFHRHEICNGGGKKKKKTFYDKGMKIVTDAELTRQFIFDLHKVEEDELIRFVLKHWGAQASGKLSDEVDVQAMFYHPMTQALFLKVKDLASSKTYFCVADFDESKKKFVPTAHEDYWSKDIMTGAEAKRDFQRILHMKGNSPNNAGSDNMKLWIVWGGL